MTTVSEKMADDVFQLFLEAQNEKQPRVVDKSNWKFRLLCHKEGCLNCFDAPTARYQRLYCDEHAHEARVASGKKSRAIQLKAIEARKVKPLFESWDGQNTRQPEVKEILTADTQKKRNELYAKYPGLATFERNHTPKMPVSRIALNIERLETIDANLKLLVQEVAWIKTFLAEHTLSDDYIKKVCK